MDSSERPLFCTWSYRQSLPPAIRSKFRDLDHFVRTLCASAHQQLFLVAPYLSPAGLEALRSPIAASASRGAWIRLLTGDLDNAVGWNRKALTTLVGGDEGYVIRKRLRVLTGTSLLPELIHAKMALSDSTAGYLGSANFSQSAMERNFELGIALDGTQVKSLASLFTFLEAQGFIHDCTDRVVGECN
jgi:phosphatidylserine/phosphatidylglycerophosphate/cardiolipin synthase-like enzyme